MKQETHITSLRVSECQLALANYVSEDVQRPSVRTSMNGKSFVIWYEKSKYFPKMWNYYFYGNLSDLGKQTRILGRFQLHKLLQIFLWIFSVPFFALSIIFFTRIFLGQGNSDGSTHFAFVFALMLPGVLVLVSRIGLMLSKKEIQEVRSFLREKLKAKSAEQTLAQDTSPVGSAAE